MGKIRSGLFYLLSILLRFHFNDIQKMFEQFQAGPDTDSSLYPGKLQWTNTVTVDQGDCRRHFGALLDKYVHTNSICTSDAPGMGSCTGDEGSSMINRGEPRTLVAIFTIAPRGCANIFPEVYTRVYPYLQFIRKVMEDVE